MRSDNQLRSMILMLLGSVAICTVWIWDLEDQKEALMFKLSKMRIEVAKCKTP